MAGNSGSGTLSWQSFQGRIRRRLELFFIPPCHQVPDCPFLQEGKVFFPISQFRIKRNVKFCVTISMSYKKMLILRYLVNFPETIFLEEKVKLPQKVGGTKFKTKPGDGRRKMSSPCDGGRDEDQGLQSSEQHFLGGENYQWPNS